MIIKLKTERFTDIAITARKTMTGVRVHGSQLKVAAKTKDDAQCWRDDSWYYFFKGEFQPVCYDTLELQDWVFGVIPYLLRYHIYRVHSYDEEGWPLLTIEECIAGNFIDEDCIKNSIIGGLVPVKPWAVMITYNPPTEE